MTYISSFNQSKPEFKETGFERAAKQRAILFGFSESSLTELKDLLLTAGVASLGEVLQKNDDPDPDYYFREGKRLELEIESKRRGANILACDDELSPRQARNLERITGLPVIDRTAIILDIFASHAKSSEGKLQVELAQLEYNMARMRGLWAHLERLGGGIGTRGPGESQLETDRRLARKKYNHLLLKLEEIDKSRARQRQERLRSGTPKLALFGYTNAGKSTIMSALSGSRAPSADRLFHTLDSKTGSFKVLGQKYIISDTVGLIDKLPHSLVKSFKSTLDEAILADILLVVIDAGADVEKEIKATMKTVKNLDIADKPMIFIFNKVDLLSRDQLKDLKNKHPDNSIFISALNEEGIESLKLKIDEKFREGLKEVDLFIPYKDSGRLNLIYETCSHIKQKQTEQGYRINAMIAPARVYQLHGLI